MSVGVKVFLKQVDPVAVCSVDFTAARPQLFGREEEGKGLRRHGDRPLLRQSFEKKILYQPDGVDRTGAEKPPDEREETVSMCLCNFYFFCVGGLLLKQHESLGATVPEYVITELSGYVVLDFLPLNNLLHFQYLSRGVGEAASEHVE